LKLQLLVLFGCKNVLMYKNLQELDGFGMELAGMGQEWACTCRNRNDVAMEQEWDRESIAVQTPVSPVVLKSRRAHESRDSGCKDLNLESDLTAVDLAV